MLTAVATQPLSSPWRRAAGAARLQIAFERVATLLVEDQDRLVPRLDARVFEVELVARLVMTGADGSTLEKRVIREGGADRGEFVDRVADAAAWATEQHPGIAITMSHDDARLWRGIASPLHDLRAQLVDRSRRALPAEVSPERRRRVA